MQRLTFHRYLERYVRSLSYSNTNSLYKLAKEILDNPRLKEPLFLYALSFDKLDVLLKASRDCQVYFEYTDLASKFERNEFVKLLEENDMRLEHGYRKVYRSYVSRRDMPDTDNDTRRLLHKKTRRLQESKNVSNYRLYTDLKLDQSNVNAYLKKGDIARVNKKTAEDILEYLEAA